MMITVGIDVGSITTKAAVVKDGEVIADKVVLTGYNARLAGENLFDAILHECGMGRAGIDKIISTGRDPGGKTISARIAAGYGAIITVASITPFFSLGHQLGLAGNQGDNRFHAAVIELHFQMMVSRLRQIVHPYKTS